MFFQNFDTIQYDFTINSDKTKQQYILQDLTMRIDIKADNFRLLCDDYEIKTNETPEIIADSLYNDLLLHWTILYMNNITNMQTDWPLSDLAFNSYITKKYSDINAIHHYESISTGTFGTVNDITSLIRTFGVDDVKSVTNFDYETRLNENKRFIRVVKPQYIIGFVKQYETALKV